MALRGPFTARGFAGRRLGVGGLAAPVPVSGRAFPPANTVIFLQMSDEVSSGDAAEFAATGSVTGAVAVNTLTHLGGGWLQLNLGQALDASDVVTLAYTAGTLTGSGAAVASFTAFPVYNA